MKKKLGVYIVLIVLLLIVACSRPYQVGDINKDEKVDVLDAILMQRYLAGNHEVEKKDLSLMDFNKDGTVNEQDVEAILKHIVGAK